MLSTASGARKSRECCWWGGQGLGRGRQGGPQDHYCPSSGRRASETRSPVLPLCGSDTEAQVLRDWRSGSLALRPGSAGLHSSDAHSLRALGTMSSLLKVSVFLSVESGHWPSLMGAVETSGKKGSIFLQGQVLCHMQGYRGAVGQTDTTPEPSGFQTGRQGVIPVQAPMVKG